MKLQYLGGSKDSFKWDYHDFLVSELEYPLLNIALMMTPDNNGNDGKTKSSLFPAKEEIEEFCQYLKKNRSIDLIKTLPQKTNSSYKVELHKNKQYINNDNRSEYFSELNKTNRQIDKYFFLTPIMALSQKNQ